MFEGWNERAKARSRAYRDNKSAYLKPARMMWPPKYTHFVVVEGDIDSGWEFKEDAQERADEIREDERRAAKVYTRKYLTQKGYFG